MMTYLFIAKCPVTDDRPYGICDMYQQTGPARQVFKFLYGLARERHEDEMTDFWFTSLPMTRDEP